MVKKLKQNYWSLAASNKSEFLFHAAYLFKLQYEWLEPSIRIGKIKNWLCCAHVKFLFLGGAIVDENPFFVRSSIKWPIWVVTSYCTLLCVILSVIRSCNQNWKKIETDCVVLSRKFSYLGGAMVGKILFFWIQGQVRKVSCYLILHTSVCNIVHD